VRAGEIVGIAGVSGNGQSELLEVLAGMVEPTAGEIRYHGQDLLQEKSSQPRAALYRRRALPMCRKTVRARAGEILPHVRERHSGLPQR
jgi:ABC-type uncharacterized transport system ATPase subunit